MMNEQVTAIPSAVLEAVQQEDTGRRRTSVTGNDCVVVEEWIYLSWIKKQLDTEQACLELPVTMLLLVVFSTLALLHLKQHVVLSVEQAIEIDIMENANFAFEHAFGNKGIVDVHSFADFWSWLRLGFVPLVIQPSWSYSERYTEDERSLFASTPAAEHVPQGSWSIGAFGKGARSLPVAGDYLHYNRIIGGVRFRQQVAEASEGLCKFPTKTHLEGWHEWYGKPCMPAWQELGFQPTSPDAEHFLHPERVEWMLTGQMSLDDMLAMVVDMEDGCAQLEAKNRTGENGTGSCLCKWCAKQSPTSPWLTEQTQRLEISMATFNAEYGLLTLTGINFFFNRGSSIFKRVELMSSWIDPFAHPLNQKVPMLFCDVLWLIMLIYIVSSEIKDVVHVIRGREQGQSWYWALVEDYISFWNVVDWVTVIISAVVLALFAELMVKTFAMHGSFGRLLQAEVQSRGAEKSDPAEHLALVEAFYADAESVTYMERYFRMQLCAYPMMIMLRLFKSFAAQARLAVVTNTLMEAGQDLVHFFVVFFGVFFCLCLCSVLFFGQDVADFASIGRSTNTCFRMMFGDWDFESMEQVRRNMAMLWFSLFMLLMVMILLNMLLAIIMENYMKVKQQISDPSLAAPLNRQMAEMWRRRQQYKRGERVRLNDIYAACLRLHSGNEREMFKSTRLIDPEFLLANVPDISLVQAHRTLQNAYEQHSKANTKGFDLQELILPQEDTSGAAITSMMERLTRSTRQLRDGLMFIQDRVEYYDTSGAVDGGASHEAAAAMAQAAAQSAREGVDQAVSDEVLEFISSEVSRLNYETASVLGQTLRRVDLRQKHIEERQDGMIASIREMHQTLLNLQSEASSLTLQLQRLDHRRSNAPKPSAWRRGIPGGIVPACFDCSPEAQEGPLPGLRR